MAHFIAPRGIDLTHRNYIIMDGLYYSFLYIKGNGYPNKVRAGWMSSLINAGEGIDVDVFLRRENRSKTIDKVAQRIRLNRTKLKSMAPLSKAHIGHLGEYYCKQVIEESRKLLERRKAKTRGRYYAQKGGALAS